MTQTTTRPEHVQVVKLYEHLSQMSARDYPINTIDSTRFCFDSLDMEIALEQQGVASEDVPRALELLIECGMIKKEMRTLDVPIPDPSQVPVYSFTHKAAAIYHGMQTDE